jgi:multiple antibiotic resistance protein
MLTLSAQAKSLQLSDRIGAFLGLFGCIAFLSFMVFVFYAYAPFAAKKIPPALAHGVLRIIAFLLICIGVEIAWHGLRPLLLSVVH